MATDRLWQDPRIPVALDYSRTAAKWAWGRAHRPGPLAAAAGWLALTDYPAARWSGRPFMSESLAARTACYDIGARAWIAPLLAACGAPPLPPVVPGGTVLGGVRSTRLSAAGVTDDRTAVVAGGHDHPMAAFAIRRQVPDAIIDSMGTAELLYGELAGDRPPPANPHFAFSRPVFGEGIACLGVMELSALLRPLLEAEDDTGRSFRAVMAGAPVPGRPGQGPPLRDLLEDSACMTRDRLHTLLGMGVPPGPIFAAGGWAQSRSLLALRASVLGCPIHMVREDRIERLWRRRAGRACQWRKAAQRFGHRNGRTGPGLGRGLCQNPVPRKKGRNAMKKLINDPAAVVTEMLEGLVRLSPGLALLEGQTVVVRAGGPATGVALISGGGAGHEPAHAGYVGPGLLQAAVAGDVFTSPSTDAVLAAIRAVAGPAGVLLIVKNYTGDRLNFGLAAELARAEGIPAEVVIVDDDVALAGGADTAGRRGIAGTVLIHKVAGAAAAAGLGLAAVKQVAQAAVADLGSMGVALSACTVPAAGKPGFTLGDDEVELGLGIHGEAGVRRIPIAPADALVETLVARIVEQKGLLRGSRVALLVNNLGGTPAMELTIVARQALALLETQGIIVERAWAGTFLTAIEMAGCSISLLALDDARLAWLDAPATAPAWVAGQAPQPVLRQRVAAIEAATIGTPSPAFEAVLRSICAALTAAEPKLTAMDQVVGDGDLGISLARGAAAILAEMLGYDLARPAATLKALSATLRRALGVPPARSMRSSSCAPRERWKARARPMPQPGRKPSPRAPRRSVNSAMPNPATARCWTPWYPPPMP